MDDNMKDAIITMWIKNMYKLIDNAYKNVEPIESVLTEEQYNTACDLYKDMMFAMYDYAEYILHFKNWGV